MVALSLVAVACSNGGGDDTGSSSPTTTGTGGAQPVEIVDTGAWPMHAVDGRYRGANGLGPADVNGDGRRDYVTNYEFDQRWIPGPRPSRPTTACPSRPAPCRRPRAPACRTRWKRPAGTTRCGRACSPRPGDPLLLGDDGSAPGDRWRWVRAAEPLALDAGRHDLSLQVREHGVAVDRIVLTTDRSFRPT